MFAPNQEARTFEVAGAYKQTTWLNKYEKTSIQEEDYEVGEVESAGNTETTADTSCPKKRQ
jgi:hypothetical protein